MACNFFLMLGVMFGPEVELDADEEKGSGSSAPPPSAQAKDEAQKAQANPYTIELASTNLVSSLKEQAKNLSDNAANILSNKAIIALDRAKSSSSVVSNNNVRLSAEKEIKLVQDALIQLGHLEPKDITYGQYDQKTAEAVRKYQVEKNKKDPHFLVDGIVGFQTLRSLMLDAVDAKVKADANALKEGESDLQLQLKNQIEEAWNNGGKQADELIRKSENRVETVSKGRQPSEESLTAEQQAKGPAAKLAEQYERFSSLSENEKKKWMREALNLYATQRNGRWWRGFNFFHSRLETVDPSIGDYSKLLGDFLHNKPKKGLNINSDMNYLAEHILGMVVKPGIEKEKREAEASKQKNELEDKKKAQKDALATSNTIGPELGSRIIDDLVIMYQNKVITTPVSYETDPNSSQALQAITEFQRTMTIQGNTQIGRLDAVTVDALRTKAERLGKV